MTHIAITLFFTLLFIGAGVAIQAMVRDNLAEIMAALRGELPPHMDARQGATVASGRARAARERLTFA